MSRQVIVRPHNKILALFMSGKEVTPAEIHDHFADDQKITAVLYRLPTYIYDMRKDGAKVIVTKDGKTVISYRLDNPADFDEDGVARSIRQTIEKMNAARSGASSKKEKKEKVVASPTVAEEAPTESFADKTARRLAETEAMLEAADDVVVDQEGATETPEVEADVTTDVVQETPTAPAKRVPETVSVDDDGFEIVD